MNTLKNIIFITALFLQTMACAQSANKELSIKLVFHSVVGNRPLILDSDYITSLGDTFSVSKFKFYISHIVFTNYGTSTKTFNDYFLVDEKDSGSQTIAIHVPNKPFTNLEFYIGVDSTKNVSGVQSGALDPANGMFWTWNSGYIMAKLEGRSPQSKAPFGNITYHIGGFHQRDNVERKIFLALGNKPLKMNGSVVKNASFDLRFTTHDSQLTSHDIIININVDLNKWFDGPHPIKISGEAFCMSPGKMAIDIADNYANMFSIKSISTQ